MKIDIKTVRELAENIEKYNLNEVALECDGVKLVLKKEKPIKVVETVQVAQPVTQTVNVPVSQNSQPEEVAVENSDYEYITAPMVGTFYESSAPGNPAFVQEGTEVGAGETLCIIEAMKLMNEVKSNKACKIVKILVKDGQIVKKGDKLFAVL